MSPLFIPWCEPTQSTGSKALYFHISKARYIEGMTAEASQALMQDLLDRTIHDGIVYRHRWRQGDMVVCDNRATTMHAPTAITDRRYSRMLWRIIPGGRPPGIVRARRFTSRPSTEQGPFRAGA